jgi:outer membrane receptor protein involved in Fe transport
MSYEDRLGIQIGARNILNTEYIAHLSPLKNLGPGIQQPGINFFVKMSLKL